MDHDLQRLSPSAFQSLAAALTLAVFNDRVEIIGRGADGGRDMIHNGPMIWLGTEGDAGEQWDGYTVFQVKHHETLSSRPVENASWFWNQVREELDKWANPSGNRDPVPDHLIFITNVPLSGVPGAGGFDTIRKNVENYRTALDDASRDVSDQATVARVRRRDRISGITRIEFWDGNKVDALLSKYDGVRRRFDAFLTASDVFSYISELTGNATVIQAEPVLLDHARTSLSSDGFVYFDQA